MTLNLCVALLSCTLLLSFCRCGKSLLCYECAASSESECNNNQTLTTCKVANQHCSTAMFSSLNNEHTYSKTCLPPQFIKKYCDIANKTEPAGSVYNCSISSCDKDYCNGPPPTTPATIATTADNKIPTKDTNNQESTASSKDPTVWSGSPSTTFGLSTLGIIIVSLALWNILEIS